jgi:cAMP phosphodiesterase
MMGMALYRDSMTIDAYATKSVCCDIQTNLFNGKIYPDFQQVPEARPTVNLKTIMPGPEIKIGNYRVVALPVRHVNGSVGYQVTDMSGNSFFYSGDTGAGLAQCWHNLAPELMLVEVTLPDRLEDFARKYGHLTPRLLGEELKVFHSIHGYLPRIGIIHMEPCLEIEIREGIAALQDELSVPITTLSEDMQLHI